jgi:hypothetical protein
MPTVNDEYKKSTEQMSDAALKAIAIDQYQSQQQTLAKSTYTGPSEIVELPSEGKPYPTGHPLASGKIEMKYMTAKEEDILTNQSYIKSGVVLDKLFQALIVTPVDYNDLLLGDKNAVMVAARVLGYGSKYKTKVTTPSGNVQDVEIDLTQLDNKEIDWSLFTEQGKCEFDFELPVTKRTVTVKLLTQRDSKKIEAELTGLAKIKQDAQLTTRLKHMITSVDGNRDSATVRKFVDEMLAIDSRAIRNFINTITPDIELKVDLVDEVTTEPFRGSFTFGLDAFWPDAGI